MRSFRSELPSPTNDSFRSQSSMEQASLLSLALAADQVQLSVKMPAAEATKESSIAAYIRKSRSTHTNQQKAVMQKYYELNKLPDAKERETIGKACGLPGRAVQVWFQNRRQRQKAPESPDDNGYPPESQPLGIPLLPKIHKQQMEQMRQIQQAFPPPQRVSPASPQTTPPSPTHQHPPAAHPSAAYLPSTQPPPPPVAPPVALSAAPVAPAALVQHLQLLTAAIPLADALAPPPLVSASSASSSASSASSAEGVTPPDVHAQNAALVAQNQELRSALCAALRTQMEVVQKQLAALQQPPVV